MAEKVKDVDRWLLKRFRLWPKWKSEERARSEIWFSVNFSLRRQKQGLTYVKGPPQEKKKKRHLHEITEGLATGDKNTVFFCLSRSWFLSLILLPKQPTSTVLVIKRVWQFIVNRKLFLKMKGTLFSETKGCPKNRGWQLFLYWLSSHRDVCRRGCQSWEWKIFQVLQDTI